MRYILGHTGTFALIALPGQALLFEVRYTAQTPVQAPSFPTGNIRRTMRWYLRNPLARQRFVDLQGERGINGGSTAFRPKRSPPRRECAPVVGPKIKG